MNITTPPAQALDVPLEVLSAAAFRYTWNIPVAGDTATLPLVPSSDYNIKVYWGDGQSHHITSPTDPNRIHTYATSGTKTILIHGLFDELAFSAHPERLLDVKYWGTQNWGSMKDMFKNCTSLTTFSATALPSTASVTDFSGAFEGANNFIGDISGWSTQSSTTMARMFKGAVKFNAPIGSWNVSNVSDFSEMFSAAGIRPDNDLVLTEAEPAVPMIFNQSLSSWDVRNATKMTRMFAGATLFNSSIASWRTGNVTDMTMMFYYARAFNQPLNRVDLGVGVTAWDVSKVISMKMMFFRAESFDSSLSGWQADELQSLERTFAFATAFNQPLDLGLTPKLVSLRETFYSASSLDQPIRLDVSRVRNFYRTFAYATLFDQPLTLSEGGTWSPGCHPSDPKSINMSSMFIGAHRFNH